MSDFGTYLKISKEYDRIIAKYSKENKMTKELTVAEISEALGYEVKVVKEQPKPKLYQFQAGDVCVCENGCGKRFTRIITSHCSKLSAYDQFGYFCAAGQREFESFGYKKVGELKAFLVK